MYFCVFLSIVYFVCVVCDGLNSTLPPYDMSESDVFGFVDSKAVTGMSLPLDCRNRKQKQDDQHNIRMTDALTPFKTITVIGAIYIDKCLPIRSYVDEFKVLNINPTMINTLDHTFDLDKPLPPGNYTEGLKIQNLSITNEGYTYIFKNTLNFLEPLSSLKTMYVSGIEIPPLPKTMGLIVLALRSGSSIIDWGNCGFLERFHLSNFDKTDFPIWPKTCTRLEYVEIERLLPETALIVVERMMAAASSLQTLKINNCQLYNLPIEFIRSAKNLLLLDLSNNNLYDELFWMFPFHGTLRILNLSRNTIQGKRDLGSIIPKLPSLVELILKDMDAMLKVCLDETNSIKTNLIKPLQNSSIEVIDFGATYLYVDCIEGIRFKNLKHITMLQAASAQIKLLDLPQTDTGNLEVDFGSSTSMDISFNETDYETLRRENSKLPYNDRNLTVWTGFVDCDCKHGWLAKALRDFPHIIAMPTLTCNHIFGNHILMEPKEHIECNKTGLNYCLYRQSWRDGSVTAQCEEKAWTMMPKWPLFPLHGLNVSGQGIFNLNIELPDDLQWIDLRRNRIARASAEQAAALFAAGRRVWLADNLLLCDCDNRALIDAIQLHKYQVEDYDLLKCVGTGKPLRVISPDALCQVALTASLAVSGVLLVIAGLITVLLRRYGEQLRMFLYSRGWCLTCLRSQDSGDKPFDAFISFAHEDREYVMETLLPGLENAPEKFRICVHYRDWVVGDWIPAQIMRSVQLSKRTLILMSRNFVASAWSTLEFRYSIANADEDINAKVLILIKDDVLDMNFDTELRRYITYNTYLHCEDPWFWEKLRYAMPHRGQTEDHITAGHGNSNRMNLNAAIEYLNTTGNVQEDFNVETAV